MTRSDTLASCLLLASALCLSACSESGTSAQNAAPAAWVLASEPAGAAGIVETKATAKEGDAIVLRGIIGGSLDAISESSPVFQLVDTQLTNPCISDDDHCPTPWDYCCTPRGEISAHAATIQLVDDSGSPLSISPTTQGFAGLDEVVVVGTVGPRPNAAVLTVRATGVHRVQR